MLRAIVRENDDGSVVLLSGRLAEEVVATAKHVCLAAAPPLVIEASELRGADADGIALLVLLIGQGARVENLSGYLAMRVDTQRELAEEVRQRDDEARLRME